MLEMWVACGCRIGMCGYMSVPTDVLVESIDTVADHAVRCVSVCLSVFNIVCCIVACFWCEDYHSG